ncbi:MAG: hypothetical protein COT85_07645 [Chlamydiae bacterium CG10_big_fil_rev_8_21_14_0_10_42_34]|nr:MAG: hypothetical protein COT85_07645 [Chlamydiae bacterium CG10_big_fil_rev_8_21_14_0_10_42_34]
MIPASPRVQSGNGLEEKEADQWSSQEFIKVRHPFSVIDSYAMHSSVREGDFVHINLEGRDIQVLGISQEDVDRELKMAVGFGLPKVSRSQLVQALFDEIETELFQDRETSSFIHVSDHPDCIQELKNKLLIELEKNKSLKAAKENDHVWKKMLTNELDKVFVFELKVALDFQIQKIRTAISAKKRVQVLARQIGKTRHTRRDLKEEFESEQIKAKITEQDLKSIKLLEEALDAQLEEFRRDLFLPFVRNEALFESIDRIAAQQDKKQKERLEKMNLELRETLEGTYSFRDFAGSKIDEEFREEVFYLTPIMWKIKEEDLPKLRLYLEYKKIKIDYQGNQELNEKIAKFTNQEDVEAAIKLSEEMIGLMHEEIKKQLQEFQEDRDYFFNDRDLLSIISMTKSQFDQWPRLELVKDATRNYLFPHSATIQKFDPWALLKSFGKTVSNLFTKESQSLDEIFKPIIPNDYESDEDEGFKLSKEIEKEQNERLQKLIDDDEEDVFNLYLQQLVQQPSAYGKFTFIDPSVSEIEKIQFEQRCSELGLKVLFKKN